MKSQAKYSVTSWTLKREVITISYHAQNFIINFCLKTIHCHHCHAYLRHPATPRHSYSLIVLRSRLLEWCDWSHACRTFALYIVVQLMAVGRVKPGTVCKVWRGAWQAKHPDDPQLNQQQRSKHYLVGIHTDFESSLEVPWHCPLQELSGLELFGYAFQALGQGPFSSLSQVVASCWSTPCCLIHATWVYI